jgi:tetratricopeptide (TPR) repeat protein
MLFRRRIGTGNIEVPILHEVVVRVAATRLAPARKLGAALNDQGCPLAHFFLGRYDEAASWAAMALQDDPDFQPGLRIAAASNAMAGRPEQAHKAVARLRQLNPTLRVSNLKDVLGPYQQAKHVEQYREGLRRAGLPE